MIWIFLFLLLCKIFIWPSKQSYYKKSRMFYIILSQINRSCTIKWIINLNSNLDLIKLYRFIKKEVNIGIVNYWSKISWVLAYLILATWRFYQQVGIFRAWIGVKNRQLKSPVTFLVMIYRKIFTFFWNEQSLKIRKKFLFFKKYGNRGSSYRETLKHYNLLFLRI